MQRGGRKQRPHWRRNLTVTISLGILLVFGSGLFLTENYLWRIPVTHRTSTPNALILDPLALNYPDPGFVANLTSSLAGAGYSVTYVGPLGAGVDMFRQLPLLGYDMVVIRAHSASRQAIITSQPYNQSLYKDDQVSGGLVAGEASDGPLYFAIAPGFVRNSMAGRFQDSTIFVMGCSTFQGQHSLADAFLDKGARFFVGWDNSVTIIHTDTSTVSLAREMATGRPVPEAVRLTSHPDPVYGARLQFLDWNTLVNDRANAVATALALWLVLGAVLVGGPLMVFVAPRILSILDRPERSHRKDEKKKRKSAEN